MSSEMLSRFHDALRRNKRILLAAADEHRCAVEIATLFAPHRSRTDQAAGQAKNAGIATRMACSIFECKAGALREAGKHNILARVKAKLVQRAQDGTETLQGLAKEWLIGGKRRHEEPGIPASCLGAGNEEAQA